MRLKIYSTFIIVKLLQIYKELIASFHSKYNLTQIYLMNSIFVEFLIRIFPFWKFGLSSKILFVYSLGKLRTKSFILYRSLTQSASNFVSNLIFKEH